MSASKEIREQAWAKNAPDYFVEGVCVMVDARDDMRAMVAQLNERYASMTRWYERLEHREQVLDERENSLRNAMDNMTAFVNQTYGPDSEIAKLNRRLDRADETSRRVDSHATKLSDLEGRVTALERKTG